MVGVSVGGRVAVAVGSGVDVLVLVGSGVSVGGGVGLAAAAVSAAAVAANSSADGPAAWQADRANKKMNRTSKKRFIFPSRVVWWMFLAIQLPYYTQLRRESDKFHDSIYFCLTSMPARAYPNPNKSSPNLMEAHQKAICEFAPRLPTRMENRAMFSTASNTMAR